jgi:hypothetical protein
MWNWWSFGVGAISGALLLAVGWWIYVATPWGDPQ